MSLRSWSNSVNLAGNDVNKYVEHDSLSWEYVNSSINLAEPQLQEEIQNIYKLDAYNFYKER